MNETTISQKDLQARLLYSPETGAFTRRDKPNAKVGTTTERGYVRINIDGRSYRAHRLAWLYMTGDLPECEIDHINGQPNDNRFTNLRKATAGENSRNRRARPNAWGAKGVTKRKRQFRASIKVGRKWIYLGLHPTIDEAAHAYNKAAIHYFGDFACLNPIGVDK